MSMYGNLVTIPRGARNREGRMSVPEHSTGS